MIQPTQEKPELLQISEIRYRRLFESARDGIVILDALTRKITDVNPFMVELLGYSRDEFVGKELLEIGLLQDAQASAVAFRELQEKGYIRYENLPLQTKDGQTRPVEFVSNIYDENGHQVIQCNIRDISDRKRAEAAELESKRFLQSTLGALSSHIAVLDETGTIIAVNQAWRHFAEENDGAAVACGVGANYLEVCEKAGGTWAQEAPAIAQGIREVIAARLADFCLEYPCHSPREQRWFNVCVTRFDGEGAVYVAVAHENITAHKLAETTLRENETKFRTIFETALDAILLADDNGLYVDANPAACALLGLAHRQIMGRSIADFVAPSTRDAVGAAFEEFLREGQQSGEFVFLRPDGSERQAEFRAVAGLLPGVHMSVLRDITERKQAEQELRDSEARKSAVLETALDCIIGIDAQSRILEWNPASEKTFGYAREEVMGKLLPELIIPESLRAAHFAGMENYLATGEGPVLGRRIEVPALRKNGEEFSVELAITRIESEGIPVFTAYLRDITQRKQAEDTLRASEELNRSILESSPDCINLLDMDEGVLSMNGPGLCLMEVDNFEMIEGQNWGGFWKGEAADLARAAVEAAKAGGSGRFQGYCPTFKGTPKWWDVTVTPILNEQGQPARLVSNSRDITESKLAEESLRRSEERYRSLAQATAQIIWSTSADGITVGDMATWREFTGQSLEEIQGWGWMEAVHPEDRKRIEKIWLDAVKTGKMYETEYRLRATDGSYRLFETRGVPILDDGGIREWVGTCTDIHDRRQAEQELQDSNARFESIVANVPGMVYQFTMQPDGAVEFPFVSEGCWELFGVAPEEIRLGAISPIQLISDADRAEFERSVAESAKNLSPWRWEGRFKLADGTTKWVQGASRPRRLPDGGTLWDGLLMDITARKEAEEERDRFFTLSLDMLAIADNDGYFKRLNPAFEATLGHSNAELMAKPFLEWVHPDDRAATLEAMKELDAGASTLEFVNRYRCSDGSYLWLSWVSTPFEGLIYAAAHDVTSLKNAEAALQKANDELELHVHERTAELSLANAQLQSEMIERQSAEETLYKNHEFLQAVLENTAEGIVACDAEGQLTFFNRATREFHGLPLEPLSAEPWSQHYSLYASDGVTPMRQEDVPLFRALGGEHVRDTEMVIAPHNGSIRLVTNNGEPLFDADGAKLGAVVVMHDITERKQAEVELQRARQEAETANRAKSEFLSRMSHELRTPLNAILGFAQLLSKQDFAPAQKERVQHILKAGRHLLDLINEVLEIARIEAGQMLLSMEPVHVRKTIQEVFSLLRPLADEQGIQLQGDDSPDLEVYVGADLQRLKQVLLNLCSNAIKYNRPQGTITVTCQTISGISSPKDPSPANLLQVNVTDTGMGMTPAAQAQLFVPFMRMGAEQTTIEGTGLGLALSLSIMHAMDGTIGVESTVGVGSTFWVQLPLTHSPLSVAEEALGQAVTMDVEAATASATRHTLLYIEDNLSNLRLIEAVIADEPIYDLISAMQGQMGLDLARQHHPDLILLDLHLPDLPGDQVLAQLKSNPSTADIPVVMLSAVAVKSEIQRLLAAGATAYLTKPLDVALFLDTLDNILQPPQGSI